MSDFTWTLAQLCVIVSLKGDLWTLSSLSRNTKGCYPHLLFKVRKEVLQVIASDAPHIYFHNGVSYKDVQLMATTLFDQLLDDNQSRSKRTNIFFSTFYPSFSSFELLAVSLPFLVKFMICIRNDCARIQFRIQVSKITKLLKTIF